MKITTVEQFNAGLQSIGTSKKQADEAVQNCALFAIQHSIQHSNADPAIRLCKTMQKMKYGNLQYLVSFLVKFGNLTTNNNKITYESKGKEMQTEYPFWLEKAKEERIKEAFDVKEAIDAIIARANREMSHAQKKGVAVSDYVKNMGMLEQLRTITTRITVPAAKVEKPKSSRKPKAAVPAVA